MFGMAPWQKQKVSTFHARIAEASLRFAQDMEIEAKFQTISRLDRMRIKAAKTVAIEATIDAQAVRKGK